ncbi:site-specific integrase [Secundilactobacillus hailunensis]|uniref:Site-specific integrase n=1 Tax=Secundilactobacillus hailunensis TaxID=2559923 RepID=A0ABW1T9D1_9LACO|nr:site-specific integrase [Secundilactobacillus hailunensis]
MKQSPKFIVYNHALVIKDNQLINRKFIVIKFSDGQIKFTDFHKYIKSRNNTVRSISDDGNRRFDFVVKMLNYVFFNRQLSKLDNLTVPLIQDFFNLYGQGELPGDSRGRAKSTVEACISAVMDFLELFIKHRKRYCSLRIDDFYKLVPFRDKRGMTRQKKVPVFDVLYSENRRHIFRDMPNSAFEMLFEHIAAYHKEILMLVSLSAFAGLRPAEACNVRRTDSPLGIGLIFSTYEGEVEKVQIDLRHELCLRSDLKSTGRIKKERLQTVPLMFTDAFVESYNNYMAYLTGKQYESDFGALSINKQGRALTYDSYYQKFRTIIKKEMIPKYLASGDDETVMYGHLLLENNISPHVFRHWFTVQLVLAGVDNVAELMAARGDSSPDSSLVYLQNKGELEKQYRKVSSHMFDYFSWAAQEKNRNEGERD